MRNAFARHITAFAQQDQRVVLLSGDIGNNLFNDFKAANTDRFINCGIAEQNMMGVAGGLAMQGLRPVVYTIAPFTTTRCLEQIKIDACYHNVPVVIVGTGAGLSYADLGPTHLTCEDIAILRVLPNLTIFCPSDPDELRSGLAAALQSPNPVYIRLGKKGEPALHAAPPTVVLGQALTIKNGSDVCFVSTGTITAEVVKAAGILETAGISARVESFHTVKPLDHARLAEVFAGFDLVVVVEEHSRIGGLGSAVAEWAMGCEERPRAALLAIGIEDRFMHEVGSQTYARHLFGLSGAQIAETVAQRLAKRS